MKITKNKQNFRIDLNQFELQALVEVAGWISGDDHSRHVFSDKDYSLLEQAENLGITFGGKNIRVKGVLDIECFAEQTPKVSNQKIGLFEPFEDKQLKMPSRDKFGKFLAAKKNVRFWYVCPDYRKAAKRNKCEFKDIQNWVLERRNIVNCYKKDGYLWGNDVDDGHKLKKFDLSICYRLRYYDRPTDLGDSGTYEGYRY